jgi:hypothetical protein
MALKCNLRIRGAHFHLRRKLPFPFATGMGRGERCHFGQRHDPALCRRSGVKVSAGSIDEQLIGRALLRAFAEKFDRDAEAYRRERLPYQLVDEAELDDQSWHPCASATGHR